MHSHLEVLGHRVSMQEFGVGHTIQPLTQAEHGYFANRISLQLCGDQIGSYLHLTDQETQALKDYLSKIA